IDAAIFRRDIAPILIKSGAQVTLYASTTDKALHASKRFHKFRRIGDATGGIVAMKGIETIDATNIDTSFLGHSYFAENRSVVSDIFYIFHKGLRADERAGLTPVGDGEGRYWSFRR